MRCGNVLLRSVDSVVAGIVIEHRKTIYPEDDAVACAEVYIDRFVMARSYLLWRCRRELFMQYKDEAQTGEDLHSPSRAVLCLTPLFSNETICANVDGYWNDSCVVPVQLLFCNKFT